MRGSLARVGLAAAVLLLGLWPGDGAGQARSTAPPKDSVRLQLKWLAQAQFAGYYAARAMGFYEAESLDVAIQPGGPDLASEKVVADGGAELGIDWLPSLLAARDQGLPLVNIAQVFAHSGMRMIALKASRITGVKDFRGRRVGVWLGGNEFELFATLAKHGLDRERDLTLVPQPFDMGQFLRKEVDATAAMTYNEYKQVLDAGVKPADLVVIDFNREGTAMLEDGVFVREDWLREAKNRQIAARFLRASLRGWAACRRAPADCVEIVVRENPSLDRAHQTWMMAEVIKLIWGPPAPRGPIGRMDAAAFARTAGIALQFGVIQKAADASAYTHVIWELARKR
jgi:NitT/TauT family transport system substrate-binding protein